MTSPLLPKLYIVTSHKRITIGSRTVHVNTMFIYINEKTAATWSGYLVVSVDLVTNMNWYVAMMYWTCADDEFYQVTDSLKPENNVIFSECDILHGLHSVPGYLICMDWWSDGSFHWYLMAFIQVSLAVFPSMRLQDCKDEVMCPWWFCVWW